MGTHNCHVHATCTNIKGSFTCACNRGFHGTGYKCVGKFKITTELCYSKEENVIVIPIVLSEHRQQPCY